MNQRSGVQHIMLTGFHGAKAAIYIGDALLIYQRDSDAAWPDMWDFPGGGREGGETPFECLLREVREEFALRISDADIRWQRSFAAMKDPDQIAWFFVIHLPAARTNDIVLGSEGQRWTLMAANDVLNLPNLVPGLKQRLTLWLHAEGEDSIYKAGQPSR